MVSKLTNMKCVSERNFGYEKLLYRTSRYKLKKKKIVACDIRKKLLGLCVGVGLLVNLLSTTLKDAQDADF